MYTELLSQALAYADVLNYQTVTNTSADSLGIDMADFKRVLYTLQCWSQGAAGQVVGQLQSCQYAAFNTNVHNIQGTSVTLTVNNQSQEFEVSADQVVGANPLDRYVRLNVVGSGNAVTVSAIGQGGESMQKPAAQFNLASTYLKGVAVCNF
jgi:hypothetical protein